MKNFKLNESDILSNQNWDFPTDTIYGPGRIKEIGQLCQNNVVSYSSPVQVPGTSWKSTMSMSYAGAATKTDGTLWTFGMNEYGQLGHNNRTQRSSPTQISGTTWDICSSSGIIAQSRIERTQYRFSLF